MKMKAVKRKRTASKKSKGKTKTMVELTQAMERLLKITQAQHLSSIPKVRFQKSHSTSQSRSRRQ